MIAYKYAAWMALLIFTIAGGGLGWWYTTRTFYLRDMGAAVHGDTTMEPGIFLRRQLRRLVWTAAGVVAGFVGGMMALMSLTLFRN